MSTTISEVFNNWIQSANSQNTKTAYSRSVNNFFNTVYGKAVDEITEADLSLIKPIFVNRRYKETLSKQGVQDSTIAQHLKITAAFLKQLEINQVYGTDFNYRYIYEIALKPTGLKNDSGKTSKMSLKDIEGFQQWLISDRFKDNDLGRKYALLSDTLWITGSRISAVFNMQWIDFVYDEDTKGIFGYSLYIDDKGGKTNWKPISTDFYNQLHSEFYEGKELDKVFKSLSSRGFGNYLREYGETVGRDFAPHSIKKGAVSEVYFRTKDLELTKRFADHNNIQTTLGYIELDNDRSSHGSYILSNDKISINDLKGLSKEQLLGILQSRQDLMLGVYYESIQNGLTKGDENIVVNS